MCPSPIGEDSTSTSRWRRSARDQRRVDGAPGMPRMPGPPQGRLRPGCRGRGSGAEAVREAAASAGRDDTASGVVVTASTNRSSSRLTTTGSRIARPVPAPLEHDQRTARAAGEPHPVVDRAHPVLAAVQDEHGAPHGIEQRTRARWPRRRRARAARRCSRPGSAGRARAPTWTPPRAGGSSAARGTSARRRSRRSRRSRPRASGGGCTSPTPGCPPAGRCRWRARTCPRGCNDPHTGPIATSPCTRSGCSAATWAAQAAPLERPTSTARSTPAASITATVSAAYSAFEYAAAPSGRSEPPLPRPSKVTTRWWRARWGTCAFHIRDRTIDQAGSSTTVAGPDPCTANEIRVPPRTTTSSRTGRVQAGQLTVAPRTRC